MPEIVFWIVLIFAQLKGWKLWRLKNVNETSQISKTKSGMHRRNLWISIDWGMFYREIYVYSSSLFNANIEHLNKIMIHNKLGYVSLFYDRRFLLSTLWRKRKNRWFLRKWVNNWWCLTIIWRKPLHYVPIRLVLLLYV